jgi:DNA-directed RNA polymerase II subunit RPB2
MPEHAKVGLTKHLVLIASITVTHTDMIHVLRSFLKKRLIDIRDVEPSKLKNLTKVFLNGDWLGLTDKPFKIENEMRTNKLNGTFEPTTSIVHDIPEREIRVYCDGGRLYRPIMMVKNNEVLLTKQLINNTSINKVEKDKKITSWDEFIIKNPGVIEYIDMEEQPYLMISESITKVEDERIKMIKSIEKVKDVKSNTVENRYDDMMFLQYTHCEFHPSFLLGEIPTNIPFCNSNAGPRNIFQYAQTILGIISYYMIVNIILATNLNCEKILFIFKNIMHM